MKGDFTRDTFRAGRHSWGVLRQQGRVDLDADWNEQVRIARHHRILRTVDLIGRVGGAEETAGFEVEVAGGAVSISAGRYYVGGVLCENDAPVDFDDQPDGNPEEALPDAEGLHLAYLDVWDRQVTAQVDPTIREVALGGPDTATRATTAWQVRTTPLAGASPELAAAMAALAAARAAGDDEAEEAALQEIRTLAWGALCADPLPLEGGSLEPGTGTMAARASAEADTASDPCRFEPGGGYRRLENRLYRVEIHEAGGIGAATFKWSRDNGSLAFGVEQFLDSPTATTRLVVRRLGFDSTRSLRRDDWVEVVSDEDERAGRSGTLVQIAEDPDPADRILVLSSPVDVVDLGLHPIVRRWDGAEITVRNTWTELEDGVEVRFAAGDFHPGDYWTIPARTNTADVEWPPHPSYPGDAPAGAPMQLPPAGIERRRAPLAVLAHDGSELVAAVDQRRLYPTATEHAALFQIGGDGQRARLPDGELPWPLQVGVADGERPAAGRMVVFEVVEGGGSLSAGGETGTEVTVPTDAEGVASVAWTVDVANPDHRVEVRLLDRCEDPTHLPVYFNAHVDFALHYLSGTGQEGMPGEAVAPLRVWVSDGRFPVEGATVAFTVDGGGSLDDAEVETDGDGVAEVVWTLGPTQHRQEVVAQLMDGPGPGASPVHEASVVFHANLSLAGEVAYTPADDCTLGDVGTVQEALDALCRREAGGTCRVVVGAEADLAEVFRAINEAGGFEGAICIAEGDFEVDEPLVLEGAENVTVRGVGRATRILVRNGDSALRFQKCRSVLVRDLSVATFQPPEEASLAGALHFEDCGPVTVEGVSVACAPGPLPRVAGITVAIRRPIDGLPDSPVRIRGCDLEIGLHQIGILAWNLRHVSLEDNVVRPGAMGDFDLERLVEDEAFVERTVDNLLTFEAATEDSLRSETFRWRRTEVETEGGTFEFAARISTPETWGSVLEEIGVTEMTVRQAEEAMRAYLAETLRSGGEADETIAFRRWFTAASAELEASPFAGVVVGGEVAGDVRILHNAIYGAIHGIVVGAELEGIKTLTRRLQVTGNSVEIVGRSPVYFEGAGISVGACESLVVSDNTVAVVGGGDQEDGSGNRRAVEGVLVAGVLGPRMIVRGGHYEGTAVGVRVELRDDSTWPQNRRWVAMDNVATTGVMLVADCEVVEDGNVPPRPEPCPGDQPAPF